MMIDLRR